MSSKQLDSAYDEMSRDKSRERKARLKSREVLVSAKDMKRIERAIKVQLGF